MTSLIDTLSAAPLFSGLPPARLEDLVAIAVVQEYGRGQVVFSEGDAATGLYVVLSGRVKVFKLAPDGKEQILHLFGEGQPIGEVAAFSGEAFPAHAQMVEAGRIAFFPRDAFVDLIRREPSLALGMLAVLSRRLRRFAGLIEDLSLKEVPGRLAAYLLYLSETSPLPPFEGGTKETSPLPPFKGGTKETSPLPPFKGGPEGTEVVMLDMTKTHLASLLGTIPETLSRILARLAKEGYIELVGARGVRILDRAGLEALATGEKRLV